MTHFSIDFDEFGVPRAVSSKPSSPASIVCIGDSITRGATGLGYCASRPWPVLVGQALGPKVNVTMCGHLGASTVDYRTYEEWGQAKAALPHADVVTVGLGTNDVDLENARDEASVAQVVERLEDMVAEILRIAQDSPEIAVLSVPQFSLEEPIFRERFDIRTMQEINRGIDLLNPAYRRMCRRHGWHYLDYASAINQRRELFGNSIHPNQRGYEVIAEVLGPRLAALLGA